VVQIWVNFFKNLFSEFVFIMPNFSRYASGVLGVCLIISLIGAKAFSKCTIIFAFLLFVSVSNLGVSFTQNDHVSFILFEN
jgi:hypothetical protein